MIFFFQFYLKDLLFLFLFCAFLCFDLRLFIIFSVTFFKAIVGAENLFEQLVDDRLDDLEPMETTDLVSSCNKSLDM